MSINEEIEVLESEKEVLESEKQVLEAKKELTKVRVKWQIQLEETITKKWSTIAIIVGAILLGLAVILTKL